jgi:hypothetical protein
MHGTSNVRFAAVFLTAAFALQGCHTVAPVAAKPEGPPPKGEVSYALVPTPASGQYQLKRSEHAFGAQSITNEPPVYPSSLVRQKLPETTVRVKAIVNEAGTVTEVRDLDTTTSPEHLLFLAACRDAVMQWRYTPMYLVEEFDDGKGNISHTKKAAPFSLDYAFQFALVNGQPTVTPSR